MDINFLPLLILIFCSSYIIFKFVGKTLEEKCLKIALAIMVNILGWVVGYHIFWRALMVAISRGDSEVYFFGILLGLVIAGCTFIMIHAYKTVRKEIE